MVNSILQYLKKTVERYPDKPAFTDANKSITFSELDEQAQLLAKRIYSQLNGKVRQSVAVYLPKSVDCIIAFFAVIYSGNYYTPIDRNMPKARIDKIISTLNPSVVIVDGNNASVSEEIDCINIIDINNADVHISENIDLERIVFDTIDTDILYVMFTSGSTGIPKGVIVSHRSVIDYIDWLEETFRFDENTIFGNQAPFYFDNSVLDIYSTVKCGCQMVIIPEAMFLSSAGLCNFINEKAINTIFWVPSALSLVANSGVLESHILKLSKILFAGEVMPAKQLNIWRRAIPDALYANLYGPTEIAVDCTYYIVDREFDDNESIPIGKACKNTGILVLNEKDEPVLKNETGELCVKGSCLANGYYNNPAKTDEVFVQNPINKLYREIIYRTGDLVKYNDNDELIYIGRKDFQIKHRGYRIELGEIETAAYSVLEVESSCAVYDYENSRIVVFVSPETIDKKAFYGKLRKQLPQYMLPGLIVTKKELPLNPNGKIDRQILINMLKKQRNENE